MSRRGARFARAAFLAAATAAGAAQAQPAFETFRDLCVATRAEAPAALAAADRAGWTAMPAMLEGEIARQGFSAGGGRAKMVDRTLMVLYAGRGAPVIDGAALPMRACALGVGAREAQALRQAAADWAGVPADPAVAAKGDAYAFLDDAGAHRAIAAAELKTPQGRDLIRQGKVALLFVAGRAAAPLIIYAIPSL